MGWLANYADANQKIIDEEMTYYESLSYAVAATETPPYFLRTVTVSKYRYVGMTYAAAVTCAAAVDNPPAIVATVHRGSDAANYYVSVIEIARTAWVEQ